MKNKESLVQIVFSEKESQLLDLAKECRQQLKGAEDTFRKMVTFAHINKIESDRVALVLKSAGFAETRVSEFKRIAGEPETYEKYAAGKFGFRTALQDARAKSDAKTGRKKVSKAVRASRKIFSAFCDYCNEQKGMKPTGKEFRGNYLVVIPADALEGKAITPGGIVIEYKVKSPAKA